MPSAAREVPPTRLVSTIIPVFNRPAMLVEAVRSVLDQTHRPIEIVIVDDGSTDDTPRVAAGLAQAHPGVVTLVHRRNGGPGAARNAGFAAARGEFIQFLDSDDLLHPEKFARQIGLLRAHPQCGLSYCITSRPGVDAGRGYWARTGESFDRILPEFLMHRGWDTSSPLWRASTCDRIGPWSELRAYEDWEHDCRAGILDIRPVHCPQILVTVRDHENGRVSSVGRSWTREVVRDLFRAHRSVMQRLLEHELTDSSYLKPFSRKLFWIARLCGEQSLIAEADSALCSAIDAGSRHGSVLDMKLFRLATRMLGWPRAVRLGESARRGWSS